jgi:hypothetical protein
VKKLGVSFPCAAWFEILGKLEKLSGYGIPLFVTGVPKKSHGLSSYIIIFTMGGAILGYPPYGRQRRSRDVS